MFPVANLQRVGQPGTRITKQAYNRTGQTLKKGAVVMEDWGTSLQAETLSRFIGGKSDCTAQVIVTTQAGCDFGIPLLVYDGPSDLPDNALGTFVVYGACQVLAQDDDEATTDVDAGKGIAMLVSTSAYAVEGLTTTDDRIVGWAGADGAASGSATFIDTDASLIVVFWTAGVPMLGLRPTA